MKVSVALPQRLGAEVVDIAREAERLGFDGLFCFDHLVPVGDPRRPATEVVSALGAIAAATQRIRIGSLVIRAGLRPTPVVAGIAATLSMVAPGRVVVGIGAGDRMTKPESERFGLAFPSLDERVTAMAAAVSAVKAVGVPVWVGGRHPDVVDAASGADALNVWEAAPDELEGIRRSCTVPVTWSGRVALDGGRPELLLDGGRIDRGLSELAAGGVDEVVLTPVGPLDLERLAGVR